jgi:hypothetical protein
MLRRSALAACLIGLGLLIGDSGLAQVSDATATISQSRARGLLLRSLVLPGWGEHALSYPGRGYIFNSTELSLWVSYFSLNFFAASVERDMKALAAVHAGINPQGKDLVYFTDIGNYATLAEYNDQKLRYRQNNRIYPESWAWAWDSEASRRQFDDKRVYNQQLYRAASFMIAGLVVNRIISIIDIVILTKDRLEEPVDEVQALILPGNGQLQFFLEVKF